MNNKEFLAIIPARGGSKRLPKKNIRLLNGIPLIAYTIKASLGSKYINETMVTTDAQEILDISFEYGANTPFLRPKELAQDDTTSIDVVLHTIEYYERVLNTSFEYIVLLQPTSPLRDHIDIDNAIEFLKEKNADAVISVTKAEHSPLWSNTLDDTLSMQNFLRAEIMNKRGQDLPDYYRLNGAIYICKTSLLKVQKKFFLNENIFAFVMENEKSVDIDTKLDFLIAETILKEKNG